MRWSRRHRYPDPRPHTHQEPLMDKSQAKIADAEEASRILNSAVFEKAFEDVRQALITALELIPTTEQGDDQAKDVRRKLAALSEVRYTFTKRIETGKLAQRELNLLEKAALGARRFTKSLSNATGAR
jgi:hypothetical protein